MDRNLDGIYFRVKRDGKWESVCFSDFTEEQMRRIFKGRDDEWLTRLCILLGRCIRNIGDQFDLVRE